MNRFQKKTITPNFVWAVLFGLWLVFLSGIFSSLTGSPGIIQAVQLNSMLEAKKIQLANLESQIAYTENRIKKFKENTTIQEEEVRTVLGYAAQDELIFDFSGSK